MAGPRSERVKAMLARRAAANAFHEVQCKLAHGTTASTREAARHHNGAPCNLGCTVTRRERLLDAMESQAAMYVADTKIGTGLAELYDKVIKQ